MVGLSFKDQSKPPWRSNTILHVLTGNMSAPSVVLIGTTVAIFEVCMTSKCKGKI